MFFPSSRKHLFVTGRNHYRKPQPIKMQSCRVQFQIQMYNPCPNLRFREHCGRVTEEICIYMEFTKFIGMT